MAARKMTKALKTTLAMMVVVFLACVVLFKVIGLGSTGVPPHRFLQDSGVSCDSGMCGPRAQRAGEGAAAEAPIVGGDTDPSISIKRPAFRVIDAHTHLHPATLGFLVKQMDRLRIETCVNFSGRFPGEGLEIQLKAARRFPGRFAVMANVDWTLLSKPRPGLQLARLLERSVKMGAVGLKIYKSLGLRVEGPDGKLLPVDSPLLDPLWRKAAALGVPVTIHTGDPRAFFKPISPKNERHEELRLNPHWSFADRTRYPSWKKLWKQFLSLVRRHPKTTFVGVHFGNNPEDVAAVSRAMDRLPNLYIDLAARLPEIGRQDPKLLRSILVRHQDRVIFGTDLSVWVRKTSAKKYALGFTLGAPMGRAHTVDDLHRYYYRHWTFLQTDLRNLRNPTPIQGRWRINAVDLPRKVLLKIYRLNAIRVFRLGKGRKK